MNRNHPQLTFDHYHDVLKLAERKVGSREIHLPSGLAVRKEGDTLAFLPRTETEAAPRVPPTSLAVPGVTSVPGFRLGIRTEILPAEGFDLHAFLEQKEVAEEAIDADRVRLPLRLRSREPGDAFTPLGTVGRQKLKKFLINHKVPRALRDRVPVVEDADRVLWVVGLRIDDGVKVTAGTKRVLRMKVVEEEGLK